eukprot:scaffold2129_cov107-Isochrysis_galbana.AAC.8
MVEPPGESPVATVLRKLSFRDGESVPHSLPTGSSESWVAYLARCVRQRRCREASPIAAGQRGIGTTCLLTRPGGHWRVEWTSQRATMVDTAAALSRSLWPGCWGWQRRTLRLPRQHHVRRLRVRQRAPPPAREARGSGRRLHVSRSRGGIGHRSRATVFRVCGELGGKTKNRRSGDVPII